MFTKALASFLLASIATGALLFLMLSAIAEAGPAREAGVKGTVTEFVRLIEPKPLIVKTPPRPTPPAPPEPPRYAPPADPPHDDSGVPAVENTEPVLGGPTLSLALLDGNYLPIVRVDPKYPPRAARVGIEGYVLMEFTVTATGRVVEPIVIFADPVGYFEQSATEAVLKYRYKPRVEEGVPRAVPGVRTVFTYKLSGAG